MKVKPEMVGHRVLVDGMMGSGKSTFARTLGARTGLPVIHLDVHYWRPGWVRPSDDQWRQRQRTLLAGESWIIEGNYNETLSLRLERADTVVFLSTPWWLCSCRALRRGLRAPAGVMPEGCQDSVIRRLRDEWGGAGRIWRRRHSEPARPFRDTAARVSHVGARAANEARGQRVSRGDPILTPNLSS
jgi:hypothetical protein